MSDRDIAQAFLLKAQEMSRGLRSVLSEMKAYQSEACAVYGRLPSDFRSSYDRVLGLIPDVEYLCDTGYVDGEC